MAKEEKRQKTLGFLTPARDLESFLASALAGLTDTKKSWQELEQIFAQRLIKRVKELEADIKALEVEVKEFKAEWSAASPDKRRQLVQDGFIDRRLATITDFRSIATELRVVTVLQLMCKLGEQGVETHERLTKVEKVVRELKLAMK